MNRFKGLFTALVTPFTEDNRVDYDALLKLLQKQIDAQIDGVVVNGTSGESPTLTREERREILSFVVKHFGKFGKVIAGSGTNNTVTSIELSQEAEALGADALMIVNPYYNKPTQEGLFLHFKEIADSVSVPIILYNIAGRTSINMDIDTLKRVVKNCKNVVGVKEASGNLEQIMEVIHESLILMPQVPFSVLCGDDALIYPSSALGACGAISVAGNIIPKTLKRLIFSVELGEYKDAMRIHYKILKFLNALFAYGTNPMCVKYLLAKNGIISNNVRLPLHSLDGDKISVVQKFVGFQDDPELF